MPDRAVKETTHVLMVDERRDGAGLSMYSPQMPGFAFGRATQSEFLADYQDALRKAGVRGQVESHNEYFSVLPDGQEYSVRWSTDQAHVDERVTLAQHLIGILEATPEMVLSDVDSGREVSPDGIVRFVCALPSDRLGWIIDQMDPNGEILTICTMVTNRMIFGTSVATAGAPAAVGWPQTDEFGWTRETTIGEMMVSIASSPERRKVAVAA
ncbi:hypothetical protein RB608_13085 [Nocardioides sp. LHD-245]|uniref:hypothetical protein n=1 Tax=Nocardioides sp. LHD-245 TaxID=3051387 RepID=UPI0027DFD8D9|nr:hypothetical protein [Nocardioides sp. LHD-245]